MGTWREDERADGGGSNFFRAPLGAISLGEAISFAAGKKVTPRKTPRRPIPDTSFMKDGSCHDKGDLFIGPLDPESNEDRDARIKEAKAICAVCPVFEPCTVFALKSPNSPGIVAGMTRGERYGAKKRSSGTA